MNKKLVFSFIIALATNTTLPMLQRHKINTPIKRVTVPHMAPSAAPQIAQPLAINLADWQSKKAQETMTALGALTLHEGQKKLEQIQGYDRIQLLHHCSDDQRFMLFTLALPKDILHNSITGIAKTYNNIFDKEICENDEAMKNAFYQKPLGKALECYALMKERYDKKRKNSYLHLISLPALYSTPPKTLIEFATLYDFLIRNPNTTHVTINKEQENALSCLPPALKMCHKNILFLVEPTIIHPLVFEGAREWCSSVGLALILAGFGTSYFYAKNPFIPSLAVHSSIQLFYGLTLGQIVYKIDKKKNQLPPVYYKTIKQLGQ